MTSRRSFLLGLGAALAAPAIVRAEVLMPVKSLVKPPAPSIVDILGAYNPILDDWIPLDGRTLSRTIYGTLFDTIGHEYGGEGDSFKIPDLRMPGLRVHGVEPIYRMRATPPSADAISTPVGTVVLTVAPPCQMLSAADRAKTTFGALAGTDWTEP